MEAAEVGLYLCLTCVFAGLLLSPASSVRHFIWGTLELRALMGLAIGATVVAVGLRRRRCDLNDCGVTAFDLKIPDEEERNHGTLMATRSTITGSNRSISRARTATQETVVR